MPSRWRRTIEERGVSFSTARPSSMSTSPVSWSASFCVGRLRHGAGAIRQLTVIDVGSFAGAEIVVARKGEPTARSPAGV
jgi:hypothetical protein